jgi:hypothetical protein
MELVGSPIWKDNIKMDLNKSEGIHEWWAVLSTARIIQVQAGNFLSS